MRPKPHLIYEKPYGDRHKDMDVSKRMLNVSLP